MLARIAIAASALTLVACQSMTGTPAAPAATAAAAAARVAAGPQPRTGELHARTRARQDDGHRGRRHPAGQPEAAAGLQSRGVGHRCGRRALDGAQRQRQDLHGHARDRPRLRDQRQRNHAHQPRGGRQADAALGRGAAQRVAVRGGDRQGAALRRHRGQPRRATGGHDRGVPAAQGAAPQLEVHRVRARRQALRAVRRAVQHLRAAARIRADPPLQRRRLGHGSDRARRAQHAGLRLASGHRRDVVHRPWPRLDGRRHARRRAQPHAAHRIVLRLSVLPRRRGARQGHPEGQPRATV